MVKVPQIPALPGCTPLGLPPVAAPIIECSSSKVDRILDDRAASNWLKAALLDACKRDCVDALADAEALVAILRQRCDEFTAMAKREAPKARYVKVDYEDGRAVVVVVWADGSSEDVISYDDTHGQAKAQAERQAKGLAKNHGCDWGTNY